MPRGNDADQAASELADRFGSGSGNAEELIIANNRERDAASRAGLHKIDDEATAELDLAKLSGPNGEDAITASVRNGVTIVAYEDEDGRVRKHVGGEKTDKPKSRSKAKAKDDDATE